jgi:hypothetical protein
MLRIRAFLIGFSLLALAGSAVRAADPKPDGDPVGIAFFEKNIRPVLVKQCYNCHSDKAEKVKGDLRLDTRAGTRKGGKSGPAVVPGEPTRGLLLAAIRHENEDTAMPPPPNAKLSAEVVANFDKWIRMGAPDPRDTATVEKKYIDLEKGRQFWAFQPPRKKEPPAVKDANWPRDDIDRFVLASLEAKGLKPVGDADRRALIRRATFALTGLPPTPEELQAFLDNKSKDAFEMVVDRLLASPRFGERWGRHWLDVARYAETNGRDQNASYPHAWRYRDYVIDAFNADRPYDRFITEQLAGDLLPAANGTERDQLAVATGFLAIGPKLLFENNPERFWLEVADEQLSTTSIAFLGLTVGCARCHDHKFDPIPTKDYYALAGIFRSTDVGIGMRLLQVGRPWSRLVPLGDRGPELAKAYEDHQDRIDVARSKVNTFRTQLNSLQMSDREGEKGAKLKAQMDVAQKEFEEIQKQSPPAPDYAMAVRDRPAPIDVPVLIGGEFDSKGELARRGYLSVMPPGPAIGAKSSGRLELARWLTSADNPLTARVMVNRVWHQLFGRGLVETIDNFGTMGATPSHPELLDHLAVRFREDGWSVKKLIRAIMLSRVYQLSSEPNEKNLTADPDNVLLWRMSQRRLDAEEIRDSLLAVSGKLDFARPEPSIYSRSNNLNSGGIFRPCRTVYLPLGRETVSDFLMTFDFPDPTIPAGQRTITTVPAQSLFFMNSFFVTQQAQAFAAILAKIPDPDKRLARAFEIAYGRPPNDDERKSCKKMLADVEEANRKTAPRRVDAWMLLCQALFASAEFRYVR